MSLSNIPISKLFWLPIAGSILGLITCISCYVLTITNGYFPPVLPLISYTMIFPPTSLIFGVGMSLVSTMLTISSVLWKLDLDHLIEGVFGDETSYQQSQMSKDQKSYQRRVISINNWSLVFGLLSFLSFIILTQSNVRNFKFVVKNLNTFFF